ncbi:MAG: RNA polymerase sigma factor [Planctomycetota bacterium]|jgi:RNA polymerase sigma-70 factor (ECF subfamily)
MPEVDSHHDLATTTATTPSIPGHPTHPALPAPQLEELGGRGFALALQMLGRREDAADAVQDALQQLLSRWSSFDPTRGELRPWFLKIVRNRCVDTIRQRARRRTEPADLDRVPRNDHPGASQPADIVEKNETLQQLKGGLMAMPDDLREIILLRDFHNLPYAEIAQVLSVPKGTVMSRLHRARTTLRSRMEKRS